MRPDSAPLPHLLRQVTDRELVAIGGKGVYDRGLAYARTHRVGPLDVHDGESFGAKVLGSGQVYETWVRLTTWSANAEIDIANDCTCPMGGDCKHVVALLLTARTAAAGQRHPTAGSPRDGAPGRAVRPAWESVMGSLLQPRERITTSSTPVAILFEAQEPRTGPYADPDRTVRLVIRPVVAGKTGWVKTGISWQALSYWSPYGRVTLAAGQVAALKALVASQSGLYSSVTDRIDLGSLGNGWVDALGRCVREGISLVTHQKLTGRVVIADEDSRLSLDLTRSGPAPSAGIVATPWLALPDELDATGDLDWRPMGRPPVGLWAFDGPDLYLTSLDASVDEATLRLLAHGPVDIPADQSADFLARAVPLLGKRIRVESSDASVDIQAVRPPRILLQLTHGPGVRLGLRWFHTYVVGDTTHRIDIDDEGHGTELAGLRDLPAEAELLAGLDGLDRIPGLRHGTVGRPPQPHTGSLDGFDVITFHEEVLPDLLATGVVDIEEVGDRIDFSEATEPPTIRLSVTESGDDRDWFDLLVDVRVGEEEVPMGELVRALTLGENHVILPTGTWFRVDRPELAELRDLVEEARAMQDRPRGPLRISAYQSDLWEQLERLGVVEEQSARWNALVAGLAAAASGAALESVPAPPGLEATLRPYQHSGFEWMTFLRRHGLGGILADDMGLGKTMQALAVILTERAETVANAMPAAGGSSASRRPPWLVVAPTSVLAVWANEAARFAPALRVAVARETAKRRGTPVAELAADADIVVTSYAILRLDSEDFHGVGWAGLILDEAQFVKNHQSRTHQCARLLEAPVKFAVTGTPMENNLMELWALLSIVAPGMFPRPTAFQEHYRRPIEAGTAPDRLDTLRRRIRPVMLRRTKELVASDLPPKQEQVLRVELPARHRRVYDRGLARERQRVLGLLEDPQRNRIAIFRSLTLLRQLSLHPGLVDAADAGLGSPKIDTLVEMLAPVVDEGHQAVVFSQFTGFLGLVRSRLDELGIDYAYLDGRTRKRQEAVGAFTSGAKRVFLVSLKAGGFGLTLTEADYVFLLDPWWNPAVEAQAVDRAHRIGQTKPVNVYRLVSSDTIEEKVLALQERKRELFTRVVDEGALAGGALSAEDIRGLL